MDKSSFTNSNKKIQPLPCNLPSDDSQLNSYKFSRPRIYVQNSYESADVSALDHLRYVSTNVGPKGRTPAYNHFLDRQLQLSRPKNGKKGQGRKEVSLNNIDFSSPTLKMASLKIIKVANQGSGGHREHSLPHVCESFSKVRKFTFHPLESSHEGSWKCAT